jgi:hypothetical protein
MYRIIVQSLAGVVTPVVMFFCSTPNAVAQHGPGYIECDGKYSAAYGYGRPRGYEELYKKFMDNCLAQFPPKTAQCSTGLPGDICAGWAPALPPSFTTGQRQRRSETPYEQEIRLFGKDLVERSHLLYQWAGQEAARRQYLIDEMRAAADRQQGNSYSIRVTK